MYPFFYYDRTYVLILIGAVLTMLASAKINSTYRIYGNVRAKSGLTARDAAERILRMNGIYDVKIYRTRGHLTDHYIPSKKELYLSDTTYDSTSIAAIGVAAHECGHAIQHEVGYTPIVISQMLYPICSIGSNLGMPILILGMLFSIGPLVKIGVLMFGLGVVISLVTLPIEYNASNRALRILDETGMLTTEELYGTKKVLRAAGLTYVASAAAAILSLLRMLILTRNERDD